MKLSHFTLEEFACKGSDCCGNSAPMNPQLLFLCDDLRTACGFPLHVNSGFRCKIHNENVGGAKNSFHTLGLAVDLSPRDADRMVLFEGVLRGRLDYRNLSVGYYKDFIHIDLRTLLGHERVTWYKRNDRRTFANSYQ
jgi:uncharacterized protein YcbK (DUF882 family)